MHTQAKIRVSGNRASGNRIMRGLGVLDPQTKQNQITNPKETTLSSKG